MSQLWDNDITGSQRPYVMELQNYLRRIQRARYGTTTVPMDGYYGSDTAAGVRQFQGAEGLPQTGNADRATWEAVYVAYSDVIARQTSPLTIRGLRDEILRDDDQGDSVQFLNTMLGVNELTYTHDTAEAVKKVQRASFLPVTGETDKKTWNAVTALYNRGDNR